MRRDLLIAAQKAFYAKYPGGFNHPDVQAIKKKHRLDKMHDFTTLNFGPDMFDDYDRIVADVAVLMGRASLVSVFEKARFKDYAKTMMPTDKAELTEGLRQMLHGDMAGGFDLFGHALAKDKLEKWPLMTVIPFYYKPKEEAFLKPTTVKNVIRVFELSGLNYTPKPNYDFYIRYKNALHEMMQIVDDNFAPDYGSFSGFLMMAMDMMQGGDGI